MGLKTYKLTSLVAIGIGVGVASCELQLELELGCEAGFCISHPGPSLEREPAWQLKLQPRPCALVSGVAGSPEGPLLAAS